MSLETETPGNFRAAGMGLIGDLDHSLTICRCRSHRCSVVIHRSDTSLRFCQWLPRPTAGLNRADRSIEDLQTPKAPPRQLLVST